MGEMVEFPGLMNAMRTVVNSQVAALCVLPNEIVVPLAPNVDVTKLFFPEPDVCSHLHFLSTFNYFILAFLGVIRLKVIEAKNLENRDISFIRKGKSDPYCEIQVGSQFLKTRTIDNDLNPVWNEYFEAVVDQWFPLEGCKHGDLHLKATWMNLSSELRHLEKQQWETEWLQADKPIHPALLMVFLDSISDLPVGLLDLFSFRNKSLLTYLEFLIFQYPKSKLEPSPFVEVTLGKETQRTPVKEDFVSQGFMPAAANPEKKAEFEE
uniref:C2 domain-containing protein n=1 Tax=Heterorhabditis bacteriophora TaxID=37862 RepID=A0A1I7XSM8_HETBA